MADLAGALDAALRARYRPPEVRSPASSRRGLLTRMNQLERAHTRKGDRPGRAARRAADASGIPLRTWQKWRKGDYRPSAKGLARLEAAYKRLITIPALKRKFRGKKAPGKVTVTATVRWTDSGDKKYNSTPYRTVNLVGMGPTMAMVIHAWVTDSPQRAAEVFERGASDVYRVPDDSDDGPGIRFEGEQVVITFP